MSSSRTEKKWLEYAGDCESLKEFLDSKKTKSPWVLVKFTMAFFRGFGQIVFANNPVSGALLLITLAITNPYEAAIGCITATIGIIFSVFIGQNAEQVTGGLTARNPIMIGIITAAYNETYLLETGSKTVKLWLYLTAAIIFSVYMTSAFHSLLGKVSLPYLTLPYNVIYYIHALFVLNISNISEDTNLEIDVSNLTVTKPDLVAIGNIEIQGYNNFSSLSENTSVIVLPDHLVWEGVFSGIVTSTSQVISIDSVPLSVVIYLSLTIYSPLMAMFSVFGAFIGTIIGIFFSSDSYEAVYKGIWGYNSLLCSAALGGQYYVLTFHTAIATFVSVIFATVLQYVLTPTLAAVNLPLLTLPANISSLLFLSLTARSDKYFPRPEKITFPEKHRYEFKRQKEDEDEEDAVFEKK